ncbi:hypothetical protein D3C80_1616500 [compost metagenome]
MTPVEAAEWQQDLRCDAVAAQVGVVHQPQDADLRIQPGRAGLLVAVAIEVVALRVLQVEQPQGGVGGGRYIVAGIQIQGLRGPAPGQQRAQQQQAPECYPDFRIGLPGISAPRHWHIWQHLASSCSCLT